MRSLFLPINILFYLFFTFQNIATITKYQRIIKKFILTIKIVDKYYIKQSKTSYLYVL